MARLNHSNAGIRNTIGETRLNAKLDDITEKGQKAFYQKYNSRQKTNDKYESELEDARCKSCGSDHIVAAMGTGPHAYKWTCGTCKSFIKWTSNPLSEDILENPRPDS
jgi:hypothetical protein